MQPSSPPSPHRANSLGARHLRRVALLLTVSGWLTAVMTLGWTVCLCIMFGWQSALVPAPGVLAGLLAVWFAGRGRPYVGGSIEFLGLYAVVCLTSLFLDQTTAEMPRTTHLFLVPLATGVYMGMRGSSPVLRHSVVAFIFLTFIVLASTPWGNQPGLALPDTLRPIGGIINTVAATVAMYVGMYIMPTWRPETPTSRTCAKPSAKASWRCTTSPRSTRTAACWAQKPCCAGPTRAAA